MRFESCTKNAIIVKHRSAWQQSRFGESTYGASSLSLNTFAARRVAENYDDQIHCQVGGRVNQFVGSNRQRSTSRECVATQELSRRFSLVGASTPPIGQYDEASGRRQYCLTYS